MDELETLVRRVVDAVRARNNLEGKVRPIVLGAASEELATTVVEAIAPFPLPPSYMALLAMHDGIEGFYGEHGDLVSTRYRAQHDHRWADRVALATSYLFAMDEVGNAAFFDGTTGGPDGEMEVIEALASGETLRHASLVAFLAAWAERLEARVRAG